MRQRIILSLLSIITIGCAHVPENGSILSEQVSLGISRMQAETESIIKALANVERAVLDDKWEEIYRKAETLYRKKEGISDTGSLTEDHRIDVATIAASHRENILLAISNKESELIERTRANSSKVIEINETVRNYLLSLENLDSSRNRAKTLIKEITGVDVSTLIGSAENAISNLPDVPEGT